MSAAAVHEFWSGVLAAPRLSGSHPVVDLLDQGVVDVAGMGALCAPGQMLTKALDAISSCEESNWRSRVVRHLLQATRTQSPADLVRAVTHLVRLDWPGVLLELLERPDAPPAVLLEQSGVPPLHLAAQSAGLGMLSLLWQHGCDVNAQDASGHTALSQCRTADQAQWLLDKGASLTHRSPKGETIFDLWSGHHTLAEMGPFNALWDTYRPALPAASRLEELRGTLNLRIKGRLVSQLARAKIKGHERTDSGHSLLDLAAMLLADQVETTCRKMTGADREQALDALVKTETLDVLWRRSPPSQDPQGAGRMAAVLMGLADYPVEHLVNRLGLPCPVDEAWLVHHLPDLNLGQNTNDRVRAHLASHDLFDAKGNWRPWTQSGTHPDVVAKVMQWVPVASSRIHQAVGYLTRHTDWMVAMAHDPWDPVLALWHAWTSRLNDHAVRQGVNTQGVPCATSQPGREVLALVTALLGTGRRITPMVWGRHEAGLHHLASTKPQWMPPALVTALQNQVLDQEIGSAPPSLSRPRL